ncbi:hypothetical protein [Streptomyces sp. NPDC017448]|uniref:hypothetical protein n=1 Tax=Streptomyces sp. NPDC017448 TaxID=3364996 RepID=UPI0037A5C94E
MIHQICVFVTFLLGVVGSVKDLTAQIYRVLVDSGVEHGNRDALSGARLPHLLGMHRIEMPLLLPSGFGVCRGRRNTRQHQSHDGCQGKSLPGVQPADTHLVSTSYGFGERMSLDDRGDDTASVLLPGVLILDEIAGAVGAPLVTATGGCG